MPAHDHTAPNSGSVLVVGSVNQDSFVYVREFPQPGETVLAHDAAAGIGGKGANQAIAAALVGARTWFVGAVGDDPAGEAALRAIAASGVDTTGIRLIPGRTGSAAITVADSGENTIVVDSGANAALDAAAVADSIRGLIGGMPAPVVVLLQGELSPAVTTSAIRAAREAFAVVVLNLAPVIELGDEVLAQCDALVLNQTEAATIGGPGASDREIAAALHDRLGVAVVLTLGAEGAVLADGHGIREQPAPVPARIADTTGAGDAFTGTLAAALAHGLPLTDAVAAGVVAGSAAVESAGTITSYVRDRLAADLAASAPAGVSR